MNDFLKRAAFFAELAHIGQYRKYTKEPYFVHPKEVADIVMSVTADEDVIAAAYLHDVVEDTDITLDEIRFNFGERVAQLVSELTDISKPEDGNRKERKQIDREHSAKASPEGQTIKLADLISNSRSIVAHDRDFARVYMKEKAELLKVLTKGNADLQDRAMDIIIQYSAQ